MQTSWASYLSTLFLEGGRGGLVTYLLQIIFRDAAFLS